MLTYIVAEANLCLSIRTPQMVRREISQEYTADGTNQNLRRSTTHAFRVRLVSDHVDRCGSEGQNACSQPTTTTLFQMDFSMKRNSTAGSALVAL